MVFSRNCFKPTGLPGASASIMRIVLRAKEKKCPHMPYVVIIGAYLFLSMCYNFDRNNCREKHMIAHLRGNCTK